MSPRGRRTLALSLVVALVALAVYANALGNGFALDDQTIILRNAQVHQLADLARIWLTPYWPNFGQQLGLYRPLAIFAYALEWALGGGAPWVFHAANILLHAAATVLVLLLLRRFVGDSAALLGALVFAVHPVHTEVVANGVGQAELIAAVAALGMCLVHATRPPGVLVPARRAALEALLFATAILAKESAITTPALLVVLDLGQGRWQPRASDLPRYLRALALPALLFGVVAGGFLLLRLHVLGTLLGTDAAPSLPFLRHGHRLLTAFRAWPEYVRLLFFPADLSADYSPGVILPPETLSPMVALGLFLLLVTAILASLTAVRPRSGLPAAWFLVSILVVSNLFFPIGVVLAERTLYLPSVAVSFLAAFLWAELAPRGGFLGRRLAAMGATALLLLMAGRTVLRNPDWKDTSHLWDALVRDHPESYHAQWILGLRLWRLGQLDRAAVRWQLAYRIWPHDPQFLAEYGNFEIARTNYPEAIRLLRRSRDISPAAGPTELFLAYADLAAGQPDSALQAIHRGEPLGVDHTQLTALRAQALEALQRPSQAAAAWRAALALPRGRYWRYWAVYARLLARLDDIPRAQAAVDTARTIAPPDTANRHILDSLSHRIDEQCYHRNPVPSGCADPLAAWGIVLPRTAQEIASGSQNATS